MSDIDAPRLADSQPHLAGALPDAALPDGAFADGDRLVVAVSEQPGSAELVRATARLADALRAPWTTLHIETPRSARFTPAQNAQLAETLHLATQLGGQVASVPAESVVEGLSRFAASIRATQIVIGKSRRSRWFELRHGSIVDALVRGQQGPAVHVLPLGESAASTLQSAEPARWGTPGGYVVSLGLVVLVSLAGAVLLSRGNITDLGLLYLLPVLVAATRHGLRTAVVTSLASGLAYNFFFIPPTHTLTIEDPRNIITVLVLLAVAIAGSQLAARVRGHALMAQASAARSSTLAGFARLLTGISATDALAQVLCTEIGRLFDANAALLIPGADGMDTRASWPRAPHFEMLDIAAARAAFADDRPAGRGTDTLSASEWMFQPLAAGGETLGVLGLSRADARTPVRPDQAPLLQSLLDQGSLALERIALETRMAELSHIRERDRLRQTLLSSVSHDLRTPLTTLLGTLAEIAPTSPLQAGQLAETRIAAERLHRFVANLLDMARIEAGALERTTQPVDLGEAIAAVLHDMRGALADQDVRVDVPLDTPMVLVDPHLFQHCLLNLIDNAVKHGAMKHGTVKHAGSQQAHPIAITARRDALGIDLTVSDHGPGIPAGQEKRIFETFARIDGSDRTGGSGLGLAIVLGFAQAMGLTVRARNRMELPATGGADFTIRFDNAHLKDWPEE